MQSNDYTEWEQRRNAERQQVADKIRAFVVGVIAYLSGNWTIKPKDESTFVNEAWLTIEEKAQGYSVDFHLLQHGSERGKVAISGNYNGLPNLVNNHGVTFPRIQVSSEREAKAAAKDIERRLLTPYREALAELQRRKVALDEHNAQQSANVQRLHSAAQGLANIVQPRSANDAPSEIYFTGSTAGFYGKVKAYNGGDANFELSSIPLADAEAVIRLLVERAKARAEHKRRQAAILEAVAADNNNHNGE